MHKSYEGKESLRKVLKIDIFVILNAHLGF